MGLIGGPYRWALSVPTSVGGYFEYSLKSTLNTPLYLRVGYLRQFLRNRVVDFKGDFKVLGFS